MTRTHSICEISSITNVNNDIVLGCTSCDGDFMDAEILKIIDGDDNIFETKNFIIDKTRPCFNMPITAWIMLKEEIPPKFLQRGNMIELT